MRKQEFNIGIIGKGKMGTSLVLYLLGHGFPLTWICKSTTDIEPLEKLVKKRLSRLLQTGMIHKDSYQWQSHHTRISSNPGDLGDCRLVIESITEDLKKKQDLCEVLNGILDADCILASNSSSLLPSEWYPDDRRADNKVGIHFFYPVALKNIVELVTTSCTSRKTLLLVQDFLSVIGRKALLQNEESAFLMNRIFLDFQAGAFRIYREGKLTFREIDRIVIREFFPIGVFEFLDQVGIDVMLFSIRHYTRKSDQPEFYRPLLEQLEQMAGKNHLGVKTEKGFYSYHRQDPMGTEAVVRDPAYETSVVRRLRDWYLGSAFRMVEKGYCSVNELDFAVTEYMNCDKGPYGYAKEIGYPYST